MGRKITNEEIFEYSKFILDFLRAQNIMDVNDLRKKRGTYPSKKPGEKLIIETRPSNLGTTAETINYVIEGVGIPIEARFNQELDYLSITLKKSGEPMKLYEMSSYDPFGNYIQTKRRTPGTIDALVEELNALNF
ncbi:hypothetical protein HY448_00960 [Candidatus Pacearchaeota archaeon]|nr:hypothetical protein [Candidatus Pacearchaeota archaeon]